MTISDFSVFVCLEEKGKKQVNIAQIKEILKVTNNLLDGKLYKEIRRADVETFR